ncbi:MAG: glycosyltransferase family 4 protein [bacterium]|nr:glycosyltransferase family 4 protein [bacterium]
MKIAMIGQKGIPTVYGGVEKHVQELAVRLVINSGYDVIAYTRPWYTSKNKKMYQGVRLQSLPSLKTKHFDAITHTFMAIVHAAFKEKVDVFHIHAVGPALLAWLPRVLRPKAKVIVTFHCSDRQHQKWGFVARMMLWLGELSATKFPHEVITVSKTLKDYCYEVFKRTTNYIPNGITAVQPVEASMIEQKFGLKKNEYIVMIARLVRHKGAHHLIEAYRKLKTDKKLVIVGGSAFTDDYVQELHDLANDDENIIFTGNQTGRVLEELFSNAYLYVLPSESEGLPIALLEAGSYGKALLASDIPANMEIVRECGLSFKNANVMDLANQLQYMIDNPEMVEANGKAARKYVMKNYLWDDVAQETMNLYESVIEVSPANKPYLVKSNA